MLSPVLAVATSIVIVLCTWVAYQLRADRPRRPAPRHLVAQGPYGTPKHPWPAQPDTPALTAEPEAEPFDPFTSPLDEVERFLDSIGVADWRQPLTPFEERAGVIPVSAPPTPRLDDTAELEPAL